MPIEGMRLVIEPTYPKGKDLAEIGLEARPMPEEKIRNVFYSHKYRCDVFVYEDDDGRARCGIQPGWNHIAQALGTLGASDAWGIEQEHNALQLLGTLIGHRAFKQYLLAGMFLETSRRSGLTYLFRKLRPTVAIDARPHLKEARILCALCMHPIAYYEGSWGGAMCPTDDVVAHLMLMRADEPMFWRRCNQHAPHRPEAGI